MTETLSKDLAGLVERLRIRAATKSSCPSCSFEQSAYEQCADELSALLKQHAVADPQVTLNKQKALEMFTEYFVANYPGPSTVISRPQWHAPKIFQAALTAIQDWTKAAPAHAAEQPHTKGGK